LSLELILGKRGVVGVVLLLDELSGEMGRVEREGEMMRQVGKREEERERPTWRQLSRDSTVFRELLGYSTRGSVVVEEGDEQLFSFSLSLMSTRQLFDNVLG